jgi:hypothetical protein
VIGKLSTKPEPRALVVSGAILGLSIAGFGLLTPKPHEARRQGAAPVTRGLATGAVIAVGAGAGASVATRNVWPLVTGLAISLFIAKVYAGALNDAA